MKFVCNEEKGLFIFLREKLNSKSKNNIKSFLANDMVFVNDKLIRKYDYILKNGDIVVIKKTTVESINYKIDIIYEDKDIIVINKPNGLLTIATEKEKDNTAYSLVSSYVKKTNKNAKIFVVHRLDKDTSGIVLFSKNENLKNSLQDNWNSLVKRRIYHAVVEGKVEEKGVVKSYLKENKQYFVYSTNDNDGKLAITEYKKIKDNDKYSLVEINLLTGRKNQIRVHFSDIKHPVIGDKKYGSKESPIGRTALHASILEIVHPIIKKVMIFEAKIPNLFYSLFKDNK